MQNPELGSFQYITIATRGFLGRVAVLADSLSRHHPGSRLTCYLVENTAAPGDDRDCQIIPIRDLDIPGFDHFCFQYTPFELCCALKPYCLLHTMRHTSAAVIYLDADMLVTHPFEDVLRQAWQHDVLVTPHLRRPTVKTDFRYFLRAGQYNAGFLGVRDTPRAHAFLGWWRDRLARDCYRDYLGGILDDQTWLDMAVALFEGIDKLHHTGINTAHWNLHECDFHREGETLVANDGEPLCLFHFSSFSHPGLTRHERLPGPIPAEIDALADDYRQQLATATAVSSATATPHAFERFSDGSPITPAMREAVRLCRIPEEINPFEHPGIVQAALPAGAPDSILNGRVDYQFAALKDRCEIQTRKLVDLDQTKQRLWNAENRLQRLSQHPLFGPLLRFWNQHVNSALAIDPAGDA